MGQPMTLRIPKSGRLVEWLPKPGAAAGVPNLALACEASGPK